MCVGGGGGFFVCFEGGEKKKGEKGWSFYFSFDEDKKSCLRNKKKKKMKITFFRIFIVLGKEPNLVDGVEREHHGQQPHNLPDDDGDDGGSFCIHSNCSSNSK